MHEFHELSLNEMAGVEGGHHNSSVSFDFSFGFADFFAAFADFYLALADFFAQFFVTVTFGRP